MIVAFIVTWVATGANSSTMGQLLLNGGLLILFPTSVVMLVLIVRDHQLSHRR
jgi:Sec-independent protein secretion pathway component TatC